MQYVYNSKRPTMKLNMKPSFKAWNQLKSLGAKSIIVQGDSQLIIGQVNGTYEVKEEQMKRYLSKVKHCIKSFKTTKFHQIPRQENMEADNLARATSTDVIPNEQIKVQYIPSIDIPDIQQKGEDANWITPIVSYLKDGLLPEGKEEAQKLRVIVAKFVLMDEMLYKRSFS